MRTNLLIIILIVIAECTFSQTAETTRLYRNDALGDVSYRRESIMDGNQVRTLFYNNGEVAKWKFQPSGEWPKGSGHSYIDGVCVLIAAQVKVPGNGQTVHPLETSYREYYDSDPLTGLIWGLEPVPGYMNPSYTKIAINTDKKSWPTHWPVALGKDTTWDGYWYGYFGKGVQNSDFESFFVMDDSKDKEYTRLPYLYQPIADYPDRGGLGLRVEVRGFQWSHVLAEDIIFWHYDVVNISDHDYDTTMFGIYTDVGVGGPDDSEDDCASFDTKLDLVYCYDHNGLGSPVAWKTGYYGYAFLETPGNAVNGIDDDEDGLIDERRDDGIDNNHNWVGYTDVNGNGKWDPASEPLNDDVGKDGLGPFDDGYTGPDEGEGDGIPTHGEPHFDELDKDESDQIGLTAISIYKLGQGGTGGGWPKDDESMWIKMNYQHFDTSLQNSNISVVFASGPFPLKKNLRERFSLAIVFGADLSDLKFHKETVQQIYNAYYNFSKPPKKPNLTAIAGDHKVYLSWDKRAEDSRNPFLGYQNHDPAQGFKKDFEGYLVYRSEEAAFKDIQIITDSKGAGTYSKPLAQFDLIDSIKGPDPVGINGARFWRGDNTGLQHTYIDTTVTNGKRYYYAICSYSMGDPNFGTAGLQPTECSKIISEDFSGTINFIDINCAVVTPNAPAAGYVAPQLSGDFAHVTNGRGTGRLNPVLINPRAIKNNATYNVAFTSDTLYPSYHTTGFAVTRTINGVTDTVQSFTDTSMVGSSRYIQPIDGVAFSISNDTAATINVMGSGWTNSKSNVFMNVTQNGTNRSLTWPADYEIRFYDEVVDTTFVNAPPTYVPFPIKFKVTNLTDGHQVKVAILDMDFSKSLTFGDTIQLWEYKGAQTLNNAKIVADIGYLAPFFGDPILPAAGDRFLVATKKPFRTGDNFVFTTKQEGLSNDLAKTSLSNVRVVPNPYVVSASWERVNLNSTGRGERKIDFINLPTECTVRIYTVAGALIKTLHKDASTTSGALSWNLVTEDGMDAAYGLYIYHIDAPGVGTSIGKFAIIK